MLKNLECSGQTLLKEILFIFSLAFYLISKPFLETILRGCIASIPPKNRSLSQMKRKMILRCKVISRRKVCILFQTKPTPLKFISMEFRIFGNSQNLKEITLKVCHFYKSTSAPFVSQSLHTHYHHSKIKRFILLVLFCSVAYQEAYNFIVSPLRRHIMLAHSFMQCPARVL